MEVRHQAPPAPPHLVWPSSTPPPLFVHTSPLGGTVQHGPRQRCSAVGSSSPRERSVRRSDSSSSQACQTSPPTAASRAVCNFDEPATGMEGFPRRNLFGMNRLERFQLSFRTFLLNPGNSFHMQPPLPTADSAHLPPGTAPACQSTPEQSAAAATGTSSRREGATPAPATERRHVRESEPRDTVTPGTASTQGAF